MNASLLAMLAMQYEVICEGSEAESYHIGQITKEIYLLFISSLKLERKLSPLLSFPSSSASPLLCFL